MCYTGKCPHEMQGSQDVNGACGYKGDFLKDHPCPVEPEMPKDYAEEAKLLETLAAMAVIDNLERLIKTDYANLTEKERESDRAEVKKYFPILLSKIREAQKVAVREYDKAINAEGICRVIDEDKEAK